MLINKTMDMYDGLNEKELGQAVEIYYKYFSTGRLPRTPSAPLAIFIKRLEMKYGHYVRCLVFQDIEKVADMNTSSRVELRQLSDLLL